MIKPTDDRGTIGLAIVTAFLVSATMMALVVSAALLFPTRAFDALWRLNPEARSAFQSMGKLSSLLLFVVGIVAGAAAFGVHRRRGWGWWLAILLFAADAAGNVIGIVMRREFVRSGFGLLITGGFLFYLVQAHIRRKFGRQPASSDWKSQA